MTDQTALPALSTTNACTRRQLISGSAIGLCGLAIASAQTSAPHTATGSAKTNTIVSTRAIHQEEDFKTNPARVYEALLDARQFSAFSGGRAAEIHREVGGAFTIFAGRGPKASIPSPGLNSWNRVPELESLLTTPVSRRNWQSICRVGGSKTIGRRCRNTWLS
jgi:hypothetical protein